MLFTLSPLRAGPNAQIIVRRRNGQFSEEDIRHIRVVMLAGVDKDLCMLCPECTRNRRTLDKLGTGPNDGDNLPINSQILSIHSRSDDFQ